MEHEFITTADQARRLAGIDRGAISVSMKRERFDTLGLGLGLGEQRDAAINIDGREKVWRLVRVEHDPSDPAVVRTGWVVAPPPY